MTDLRRGGEELHESAIYVDRFLSETILDRYLEVEFSRHVTVEHHP